MKMVRGTGPKRRIRTAIILAVLAAFIIGCYTAWRTHNGSTDFDTYYYAAKRIVSGTGLYREEPGISPYLYPPFFACIMVPFTLIPIEAAAFLWCLINIALFAAAVRWCRLIVFDDRPVGEIVRMISPVAAAATAILIGAFFLDNISLLQANIPILCALIAAFYYFRKGKDGAAGFFLACAISVKIIPILFLIYFVIKRAWRVSLVTILWLAVSAVVVPVLVMGPAAVGAATMTWWHETFIKSTTAVPNFDMMGGMFNPVNQSIQAFLARWLTGNDADILYWKKIVYHYNGYLIGLNMGFSRAATLGIAKAVTAAVIAVTLFVSSRVSRDRTDGRWRQGYALVTVASLLASPILRVQYFIFLILPLFLVLARATDPGRGKIFRAAILAFSGLYLFQALKVGRLIGAGTIAAVLLWSAVLAMGEKEVDA